LLLPIFGSPHKKKYKKLKNIIGRKPFGLFFLKIKFSLSIGPSSMKNMLSNFNLSIFKISQPIFGHFLGAPIYRHPKNDQRLVEKV